MFGFCFSGLGFSIRGFVVFWVWVLDLDLGFLDLWLWAFGFSFWGLGFRLTRSTGTFPGAIKIQGDVFWD